MRNEDSVCISFDIAPETLSQPCPKLLMQPIIENAIKHGKHADCSKKLIIHIKSEMISQSRIRITITNDGKRLQDTKALPSVIKSGYGLQNIAERVKLHFGENSLFVIKNNPEGIGVCAIIEWNIEPVETPLPHLFG